MAYVSDFAGHWSAPGEEGRRANAMFNNKVIFHQASPTPGSYHGCSWTGEYAHDNALYSSAGVTIAGEGCKAKYTLAEWQALSAGNDLGSTFNATMPSGDEIVAWGEALLL
jgi:hypothetical protein